MSTTVPPLPDDLLGASPHQSAVVNGSVRSLEDAAPPLTALDWLRGLGLTGAKEGCAEGECGACAVLLARPDPRGAGGGRAGGAVEGAGEGAGGGGGAAWTAVNACLVPAAALAGQEVVTAEGIGTPEALHPVQHELAVRGGSQCGYCTPGFVCSMAAEFHRPGRESGFDHHALSGNLCRCTGYRPIVEAADALGAMPAPGAGDGGGGRGGAVGALAARADAAPPRPTAYRRPGFVRPATLDDALELLGQGAPEATVAVAGGTDVGVEMNLHGRRPGLIVAIDRLDELRVLQPVAGPDGSDVRVLEIGAALTLTEIEWQVGPTVPLLAQVLSQFASRLIRNSATIGGNLGTGSPIGDLAPALLALDADLVLASVRGTRTVALRDYFTGYRASVRAADELIVSVRVPVAGVVHRGGGAGVTDEVGPERLGRENWHLDDGVPSAKFQFHRPAGETAPPPPLTAFHKIAKRRYDDISSVAVAFAVEVVDDVVQRAAIGLGGVAATPIRATTAEAALVGARWSAEGVAAAAAALGTEGTPLDDHRASADYRRAMLAGALQRLVAEHPAPGLAAGARA